MTASGQELLSRRVSQPSPWTSERANGVSETVTQPARLGVVPERREVTLRVSRRLSERPWFHEVLARFRRLLVLGDNWNGYGERPVHESAVKRAVNVLDAVGAAGPRPDVVPTADGGIQIEWSGAGFEVEVEVPPVGPASVLVVDASGKETEMIAGARSSAWRQLRAQVSAMAAASA